MFLPQPDAPALAISQALSLRIADEMAACGGWMAFDRWMHRVLYEPGLGYYSGPLRKFGAQGDFVTAPELSPLFAVCLAQQVAQWVQHCEPVVHEFGAGSGRLAAGLLTALAAAGMPIRRYVIVEVSAGLRAQQRETLAREAPQWLSVVEWADALPETIDGVVIGNELLDAMPVRVFEWDGAGLLEMGVCCRPGAHGPDAPAVDSPQFVWASRTADDSLRAALSEVLPRLAGAARYRSEIGLQASAWVGTVGRALRRGALLLIDYGFPAGEYYHPQRDQGTLMAHYRHHTHPDVLTLPGLQDVTAHVDFSAVARAAHEAGLGLLGYTSQARFLLNGGLLDHLAASMDGLSRGLQTPAQVQSMGAVQTLLSEAEMGELFKVIAFGRGLPDDSLGFARGDRRHAL